MSKIGSKFQPGDKESHKPDYFGASAKAIRHHYDVGNDFYKLWLDPTLTYSCAMWEENEGYDDLEKAQLRKIDYHIRQAKAEGVDRVLDIGCGWGAVLRRLVEVHRCQHAVGLTLSEAQTKWIKSLNLPKTEVRLEYWTDHSPEVPYDAILSIAAFEAFARPELSSEEKIKSYRSFFQHCHRWLRPGGRMSFQTIVYGNSCREDIDGFIFQDIFPEEDLPHLAEIVKALQWIFEVVNIRNDREDYALTLRAWLKRLKANRTLAVDVAGEAVVSSYERYLSASIFGFETGILNLFRMTLQRIDNPRSQEMVK